MGNGEWGMGNGEWGMGSGEWGLALVVCYCANHSSFIPSFQIGIPIPYSLFPSP
jgi:hypothetical protein